MIPAPASSHANTAGNAELAAQLDAVVAELDLPQPDVAPGVGRRRRHPRTRDRLQRVMTIVERGGILFVEEGLPHPQLGMPARRRARARALGGEIVHEKTLRELEGNEIIRVLEAADRKLTPHFGLRELKDGVLHPEARPRDDGRILLMVHGTFSNNDNLLGEIGAAPDGHSFLRTVVGAYDQVLAFDHKTLSISPMLNARELAMLLADTQAHVDVICHSRGGLVVRWWLEAFDRGRPDARRVVFVGAPLAGTGLAAPPRLRASLSLMANIARALGTGAAATGFLTVIPVVFQIVSSVTSFAARTPLIDAAVALIPGLAAMSRVGNNAELLSLRSHMREPRNRYFAVRSNFEPEDPGWRFWQYFRRLPTRIADVGADMVFEGRNDLVVDTGSMTNFEDGLQFDPDRLYDFRTSATVHHTNYFRQREALDFIAKALQTVSRG